MREGTKTTAKHRKGVIAFSALFCALILAIVVFMDAKSSQDQYDVLQESVENQLIASSLAARDHIDIDAFKSYNSMEDIKADEKNYNKTLEQLRSLAVNVEAEYIYALKEIDGKYYFIFDTDLQNDTRFVEYELAPVYQEAFEGYNSASIMNVDDEYGSFNSGAVPLMDGDTVVGIVGTDTSDKYIEQSREASNINTVMLLVVLGATLIVAFILVIVLTGRLRAMQKRLERMAHYDSITGLPNRQYLMDYLNELTTGKDSEPFALVFVDLDNFKAVNDNAGHDAGDELLRHIAQYLETAAQNAKSFRPAAGRLNIAARIGGDEFIQVVTGVSNEEEAAAIAENLLGNFQSQTLDRYIEKYKVGLSIGVALYPYHTEDYNVLIKYADIAMYQAKDAGKNSYRIYTDEMTGEVSPKRK